MDFADRIRTLAGRVPNVLPRLTTEEATKNALVMPFIQALGYNPFDPLEVVPEFTADVGTKKGEKVDYTIFRDDVPIMLFECKRVSSSLDDETASQLYRYFSVTDHARFGILTNGVVYKFFSDLDAANKMDSRPFFEVSLAALRDQDLVELKRFTKDGFDVDANVNAASVLKYTRAIQKYLNEQFSSPSEAFVKHVARHVYEGKVTQSVLDRFRGFTKEALANVLRDRISTRLQSAAALETATGSEKQEDDPEIDTSEQEVEGFNIVRAIVAEITEASRVVMRDQKSYCGILLDDNNRKPLARLYFNNPERLSLALFDQGKGRDMDRVKLDAVGGIFDFADRIRATVQRYGGTTEEPAEAVGEPPAS
ncbi:type I restriction endonuclease [Planctomycetota bacterium]